MLIVMRCLSQNERCTSGICGPRWQSYENLQRRFCPTNDNIEVFDEPKQVRFKGIKSRGLPLLQAQAGTFPSYLFGQSNVSNYRNLSSGATRNRGKGAVHLFPSHTILPTEKQIKPPNAQPFPKPPKTIGYYSDDGGSTACRCYRILEVFIRSIPIVAKSLGHHCSRPS